MEEKTAWEIARESPSHPVLPSARENWELESMALVLPPVISDADSIRFLKIKATMGEKTGWEIAREAPSPHALPSARENWGLESMVLVLPPVIRDADSI